VATELEGRPLVAADLVTGTLLGLVGLATVALSWAMPSFAERGADPLTAPGIFPAAVGGLLAVAGGRLALRSFGRLRTKARETTTAPVFERAAVTRTLAGFALMTAAVLAAGHVDFRLVVAGFCLAFSAAFLDWRVPAPQRLRQLGAVALVTAIAALAIPYVFETVFLVRLP
jgi:hypothetical protein